MALDPATLVLLKVLL
jgi:prevent-host-death family protein